MGLPTSGAIMDRFLGKQVQVRTYPGWGWVDSAGGAASLLSNFCLTVERFWGFRDDKIRGGVGRVSQAGHQADGLWVVFSARTGGSLDLDVENRAYNLLFMETAPADPIDTGSPWPHASYTTWRWAGFGTILWRE